jgi:hypothetical protein
MRATPSAATAEHRAEALKERVYVTFSSLAVLLAMQSHSSEHLSAGEAASTVSITVVGTLLAIFVADVVSHAVILPLIFIGLAALDLWSLDEAVRASIIALTVTLIAIGYLAVRRVKLAWWQRLIALGAEFAVGAAVVGLELLAHG